MPNITVVQNADSYSRVDVVIEGFKYPIKIDVFHDKQSFLTDDPPKAQVNFPCLGSISPQQTRDFAAALITAANLADRVMLERGAQETLKEIREQESKDMEFTLPNIEDIKKANKRI